MTRATLLPLAIALLAAGSTSAFAAPGGTPDPSVPVTQRQVVLLKDHVARARADDKARVIESVSAVRPLTKVRTVLPVMGSVTGKDGNRWVHVRLPGRPSGHTGWILADQTIASSTEWRVVVEVSARRVTVFRDGLRVRSFRAVVPKPSTPTPYGEFFVEEALSISRDDTGGPFALAISARSDIFQSFAGGPGQIAIHGTGNLSAPLGTAATHGCIRLSASAVTWMSKRIGGGVPVTVRK